jgi:hypothetical protein
VCQWVLLLDSYEDNELKLREKVEEAGKMVLIHITILEMMTQYSGKRIKGI